MPKLAFFLILYIYLYIYYYIIICEYVHLGLKIKSKEIHIKEKSLDALSLDALSEICFKWNVSRKVIGKYPITGDVLPLHLYGIYGITRYTFHIPYFKIYLRYILATLFCLLSIIQVILYYLTTVLFDTDTYLPPCCIKRFNHFTPAEP